MADATTTVIGPGTRVKGEISFDGPAKILGEVEGRITSPGEVNIGESALCRAAVEANVVHIDGVVEGNIAARQRLLLNPSARVSGDVVASSMTVAEGASLVGHVRIGSDAPATAGGATPARLADVPIKPRVTISGKVMPGTVPGAPTTAPAAPVAVGAELESSLAGLESKIAGLGRKAAE